MALFEIKKKTKPAQKPSGKGLFEIKKSVSNPEIRELIKRRRLQMLAHSCIYYRLNDSIINDHTWQAWADELKDLQTKYPKESAEIEWAEAFKDWTGDTGCHLPTYHPWVTAKAQYLLDIHEQQRSA